MSDRVDAPILLDWAAVAEAIPQERRRPVHHALEAATTILSGFEFPVVDASGRRSHTSKIEPGDDFEAEGVASLQALCDALGRILPAEDPDPDEWEDPDDDANPEDSGSAKDESLPGAPAKRPGEMRGRP